MNMDEMRDPSEKPAVESASGLETRDLEEPPPLPRALKARVQGKRVRQAGEGKELGAYRAVLCCGFDVEQDQ